MVIHKPINIAQNLKLMFPAQTNNLLYQQTRISKQNFETNLFSF